jgi:hypothetical protein
MRRGLPGDDDRGRAERAAGDPAPVGLGGEAEEAWKPHAVAIANERLRLQVRVQPSLCLSCMRDVQKCTLARTSFGLLVVVWRVF